MKKISFVFILTVCLLVLSCEDSTTRYLVVYHSSGAVAVNDDYREEITHAKIEAVFRSVTVNKIEEYGFSGCINLESVDIYEGPSVIGEYAFDNCERLSWINIPKTITGIGEHAFHNCRELDRIYYNGTEEEWEKISKGKDWKDTERTCTVYFWNSTYKEI